MTRPAPLLLALLLGCSTPGDPLPSELLSAIESGWNECRLLDADGYPLPDATGALDGARVLFASRQEFADWCRYPRAAASCLFMVPDHDGNAGDTVPLIVVSPETEMDPEAEPIVHEAEHALTALLLDRSRSDQVDEGHQDDRVWVIANRPGNAQELARARVRALSRAVLEEVRAVSGEGL